MGIRMDNLTMIKQSGAVPYRRINERLEVLLVTSIGRRRWIIPKGMKETYLTASESALAEAWEEAGVLGDIEEKSIGSYTYTKWSDVYHVEVFLLQVNEVHDDWLEAQYRSRRWYSPQKASELVRESDLKKILRNLPTLLNGRI